MNCKEKAPVVLAHWRGQKENEAVGFPLHKGADFGKRWRVSALRRLKCHYEIGLDLSFDRQASQCLDCVNFMLEAEGGRYE